MLNNVSGLNLKKMAKSPKTQSGMALKRPSVDKSMTKDGSIMIRKANVGNFGAQGITSFQSQAVRTNSSVSHDVSDPTKVNYESLNQYSKNELETIKQGINEMLDSDISRSESMQLKSKLAKVNNAISQSNQTSPQQETNVVQNNSSNEKTSGSTKKDKDLSDQQAAEQAYKDAQSSMGGVGLIATTLATAKEHKAGDKAEDATNFMNSENTRMNNQAAENEKLNEETEAKIEKLNNKQKTDLKKQVAEESKIADEQKVMETNSHEAEELQSNYSVDDAKTEEEATEKQNDFNTKLDNKTSLLQKSNTSISQTQRRISNINKQYKNNVKSSEGIRRTSRQQNIAYKNSISVASSNVTKARETAGTTMGVADVANKIGQASQMMGQAVAQVGQALQSNPYTEAAGIAMERYGNMTSMAAGVTMSVAPMIQNLAGGTNSASGVTQSSAYGAAGVNKGTVQNSKRAQFVTKSFNSQIKVATKSAKKTTQAAKATFATSQDAMINTKNTVNNNTANRINDINNTNISKSTPNINQNVNNNRMGLNQMGRNTNTINPSNANMMMGMNNNKNNNVQNSFNNQTQGNASINNNNNPLNKKKLM